MAVSSPILANPSLGTVGSPGPLERPCDHGSFEDGPAINVSRVLSVKRDTETGEKMIRLRDEGGRIITLRLPSRQFGTLAKRVTAERLRLRDRGRKNRDSDGDRELIATELQATGGNVLRTSRRLGVPRSTLRYWIEIYGLDELVPFD